MLLKRRTGNEEWGMGKWEEKVVSVHLEWVQQRFFGDGRM